MSLLSGYGLPTDTTCTNCKIKLGRWRCKDCHLRPLLCRSCCRRSHTNLPFHVLERWTGTFFQRAALWEVGLTLTIPHLDGICPTLQSLMDRLEIGEHNADESDQMVIKAWPGYLARQPAPVPSNMTEQAMPQPPDTDIDETWDRVTDAKAQSMAGHWGDDDIPDLQSVANSSDAVEDQSFTMDQVSAQVG